MVKKLKVYVGMFSKIWEIQKKNESIDFKRAKGCCAGEEKAQANLEERHKNNQSTNLTTPTV